MRVIGRVKGFRTRGKLPNADRTHRARRQWDVGKCQDERDKVELNIAISREEQEQAFQQTSLRIRTSSVDEKAKELRSLAEKQGGRIRSSTFSRDPDGREWQMFRCACR